MDKQLPYAIIQLNDCHAQLRGQVVAMRNYADK